MPHQCTDCGHTFPDGSKQMLSGCPDCGGNKFQFLPSSAVDAEPSADDGPTRADGESDAPETSSPSTPVPGQNEGPSGDGSEEDRAQASARSAVVSEDELPPVDDRGSADTEGPVDEAEEPSLAELRAELDDQFESIKILEPGQYELNLMELYDREEYIIALEEDGRYAIEVPSSWRDDEP